MSTFKKGTIVRNIIHYRKRVKIPQLHSVEEVKIDKDGKEILTLSSLALGTLREQVPVETMQNVSSQSIEKLFDLSSRSLNLLEEE